VLLMSDVQVVTLMLAGLAVLTAGMYLSVAAFVVAFAGLVVGVCTGVMVIGCWHTRSRDDREAQA
jgi:hypothetical protein